MAFETAGNRLGTQLAGVDMSDKVAFQYTGVRLRATDGNIIRPTTDGDVILGVLQNDPKAGQAATIFVREVTKAQCGGNFAPGDILACRADGKFVKATPGQFGSAMAIETGKTNTLATVLLGHFGRQ